MRSVDRDAAASLSRLSLQPPYRGVEGVPHRDIHVLMGVVDWLGPAHNYVFPRHADIDPHAVELALMMMTVGRLHHDGAAEDAVMEAFKFRRLLRMRSSTAGEGSMFRKRICNGIGIGARPPPSRLFVMG